MKKKSTGTGRKMIMSWPSKINQSIVEKQLEIERETGEKLLKPQAAVKFVEDLMLKIKQIEK